jgi:hypothetical protein
VCFQRRVRLFGRLMVKVIDPVSFWCLSSLSDIGEAVTPFLKLGADI